MNYDKAMNMDKVEFGEMPMQPFLLGLLSAFDNRFQAVADSCIGEITWKQFFAIICIRLCKEAPTLNELSEVMGSSHQNVKQILLKLEKKGFVETKPDEKDKRKQRIVLTRECFKFCSDNDEKSQMALRTIFDGIGEKQLKTTIETIIAMERNLDKV